MNSTLKKLEYNQILDMLSSFCKTYLGKKLALSLLPYTDKTAVIHELTQTTQAQNLILHYGNAPIQELDDLTEYMKSLESFVPLSIKGLLEMAKVLKISSNLKTYFSDALESNSELNSMEFDALTSEFETLYTNAGILETISKSILDENTIADEASKNLLHIRRSIRKNEADIKDKLNSFIHSSTYSKYIMEPIITIRNGRYVIPVKIEYKDNVKGFIHDISASGSTVYIEPTSIFDLNNNINNLKLEENIEIEKILEELSKLLYPIIDNINTTIMSIGKIDFMFAKASFSNEINGVQPTINTQKHINLIQARHPLIDKNKVVPIDIHVGKDFNSLLITGPNTGGKTVTLKTVGLLCLMACSGLHIPADEKSSVYVFDGVYADIGDEQSIQESLSTFSSHITNIIKIINTSTAESLILIDELGSGTDPVQGANLAISILEYFFNKGCLTISTTHYSELKQYALVTDGFENASSEFDIENLAPTYKILIGVPGKSNAFAISKKLGLPQDILLRAESLLTSNNIDFEEVIKNIYDDKIFIENEKEKTIKNSNQIEMLRKKLEFDVSEVERQKIEIISKAKKEARDILLSAKDDANSIIKELNNMYNSSAADSLQRANQLREQLNSRIKSNSENLGSADEKKLENTIKPEDISIGLTVFARPFNATGTVLTLPNKDNEVTVQIGNIKSNIKISNLEITEKSKHDVNSNKEHNSKISKSSFNKSKSISMEINVIGQTVDEAIFVVDKYLDDCYLAGLKSTRIVHGKGTGKLRQGIHTFLRTHPHVKSFRLGTFGEGEMGVTVVELK